MQFNGPWLFSGWKLVFGAWRIFLFLGFAGSPIAPIYGQVLLLAKELKEPEKTEM